MAIVVRGSCPRECSARRTLRRGRFEGCYS
jgi:hypothetical protein